MPTLAQSLVEFADALRTAGLKERAIDVYLARARRFVEWHGDDWLPPAELSAELQAYARSLPPLAAATVAAYTDGAARFIAWLAGEYLPRGRRVAVVLAQGAIAPLRPVEDIVIDAVVNLLLADGWSDVKTTSAASRAHGVDIAATKSQRQLLVEAKGWPADAYVAGPKKGQRKRHLPYTQGRAYFSNALLPTLIYYGETDAEIALAFPDKVTYRTLVVRSTPAFATLGIGVYFVDLHAYPPVAQLHLPHTPRRGVQRTPKEER